MTSSQGIPVDLRLSAYQIGSRSDPRFVWGVGVLKEFLRSLPDNKHRVTLRQSAGEVFLDLGDTGVKISSGGNGRFAYASQLGQHHIVGISAPTEIARAIPVPGLFYPGEDIIKFSGKLPEILSNAFADSEAFEEAVDPKVHFPATHFQEDIERIMQENNTPVEEKKSKKKTKGYYKREPLVSLEDIRDDCIAIVINSGRTFKQVHERGGPAPSTISKWLYRETKFPQFATIRAMLNACDHDLTIAPKGVGVERIGHKGIKMPAKRR